MAEFGRLLREIRESCHDPLLPSRRLSQQSVGELMGRELGAHGYSGAAVSDWERGKSKIHADNRLVLTALIKVLYEYGGLKTAEQANQLLESGNYRALDNKEVQKIFSKFPEDSGYEKPETSEEISRSNLPFLLESFFAISEKELKTLITTAKKEGPNPWWPRALAALMRKASDRFSLSVRTVLWIWIWLITWWLIGPSLRLPFANQDIAIHAMAYYVGGTLVVPLLIGAFVNTKDNAYWKANGIEHSILLRLYTYQGAGIGFNLGYFFVFPFSLVRYYLQLESSVWVELMAALVALMLGNMAAWVVPHNLWLAYGHLKLSDGAIFFVVALLGPLWAVFFLEFYPVLLNPVAGVLVFLSAVTIMVIITTRQSKKHDK
jgi:hypothetical protein